MQTKLTTWLALPLIFVASSVLADNPGGHAREAHPGDGTHAAQAAEAEHRDCHSQGSLSAEQKAGAKADEQQVSDTDRRKTRPSNITRKRGPRK